MGGGTSSENQQRYKPHSILLKKINFWLEEHSSEALLSTGRKKNRIANLLVKYLRMSKLNQISLEFGNLDSSEAK